MSKIPMVYMVHSGNLFGTEQMALATLEGFRSEYHPIIACPAGPLVEEAGKRGIEVHVLGGRLAPLPLCSRLLRAHRAMVYLATGISHSLAFLAANALWRRKSCHLHLVHGGAEERLSYGRKHLLNRFDITFVSVSEFVKQRLIAHGVEGDRIRVVGNFLTREKAGAIHVRNEAMASPLRRGLVISRLDPIKRIDFLLDTLERFEDLHDYSFEVRGLGSELDRLRAKARAKELPVRFPGFAANLHEIIKDFDFLLHLCPEEPFGLAILEAMAAKIPVLVPDTGGSAALITHGITGFHYRALDAEDLARGLRRLSQLKPQETARIAAAAHASLETRFSRAHQLERFRMVIEEAWPP